jgi:hypothetical protein
VVRRMVTSVVLMQKLQYAADAMFHLYCTQYDPANL